MTDAVDLTFKYTEAEYAAALRLYFERTHRTRFDAGVAVALLVGGILTVLYAEEPVWATLMICVSSLFLLLILYANFVLPGLQFRKEPKLRDEYHLRFTEEGIAFRTEHINSDLQWGLYHKVWENERSYLLFYGERAFTIIPKRVFADPGQQARFRDLLKRKIPGVLA